MPKIKIEDLPKNSIVTKAEMKDVIGGMKNDFSMFSSHVRLYETHYSGVLLQQGAVLLYNDWNE